VLFAVTTKMHVRNEKQFSEYEMHAGLITPHELAVFDGKGVRGLSYSLRDGKRDRFPSKCRPFLVILLLQATLAELYRGGQLLSAPHHMTLNMELTKLSEAFELIEQLGITILPLPYAQLFRMVTIIYLAVLPFAVVRELGWMAVLLSFLANLVYFTVDECAGEMATPFGADANDVDIEKHVRRLDKHTASILSVCLNAPVENFDLYPETRMTNADGSRRRQSGARGVSLYDLSYEESKKREVGLATRNHGGLAAQVDELGNTTMRHLEDSRRRLRWRSVKMGLGLRRTVTVTATAADQDLTRRGALRSTDSVRGLLKVVQDSVCHPQSLGKMDRMTGRSE